MKISRKMVRMKVCVFLVMFLWTVTVSRGETEVSCVFMETCILPCSFLGSTEVQIHWFQLTNRHGVHLYKNNQDQLKYQNRIYRNRTSLFKDQISRGNASLQLTGVKVQDEGLYQCFISTISESKGSFVYLKVEAPVHKVNIQQVENNITCSSEGIYPQPELTWSTTPPSNINLHNTTTVQQNEQQLYSISSSLILSDNDTDLVYNCTIKTRRNRWTVTVRHQPFYSSETTIPCTTSNSDLSGFSLVWRFNLDEMILKQSSTETPRTITTEWKQHVKDVSESGEITLQDLYYYQEGIYTCKLSNAEETYITSTILGIEHFHGQTMSGPGRSVAGKVRGVVPIVVLALLVGLIGFCICKKKKDTNNESTGGSGNNNKLQMELMNNGGGQGDAQDPAAQVPAVQDPPASPLK